MREATQASIAAKLGHEGVEADDGLGDVVVERRWIGCCFSGHPRAIFVLSPASRSAVSCMIASQVVELGEPRCQAGRVHEGGLLLPFGSEAAPCSAWR